MRIGLIGCGGMGSTHNQCMKVLSEKMDVKVTALSDCRKDFLMKAAEIWPEADKYDSGMALINNADIDVAYICLPSYLHTEHAIAAMKKGLNVFVEKPVCLTEKEAQALLDQQKISQTDVMVGQVIRSFEEYNFLKRIYENKRYGNLKSIVMKRVSGDPRWGFEDWFHHEEKSGSVVLDLHIHDVDFLRYMLGEPDSFKVFASSFDSGMVNQIITDYTFGKVIVTAEGVWNIAPNITFEAGFRANFDDATVVFNTLNKDKLVVYTKDGKTVVPDLSTECDETYIENGTNVKNLGAYYLEDKYFLECLLHNQKNERAPLIEGVKSVLQGIKELKAAKQYQ